VTGPVLWRAEHASARPTAPEATATLRELASGTARVRSVVVRAEDTLVGLAYPGGRDLVVAIPSVPHQDTDRAQGIRPLAVRMRHAGETLDCSVLGTSTTGPRRVRISLAHALALCASGVHAVVCTQ
jgi:hypothetical protein